MKTDQACEIGGGNETQSSEYSEPIDKFIDMLGRETVADKTGKNSHHWSKKHCKRN